MPIRQALNLTIREAVISDVDQIFQFILALAEYEKLSHEVVATPELLRQSLFGEKAYAKVIIAELDKQAVGFALYFYNFSTFLAQPGLYLEDLYVTPQARGQKVGKSLLAKLAQIALANNCGRFEWSVLDWNKPAIDFYRRVGAKGMGDWTTQRVEGEALLKLAQS